MFRTRDFVLLFVTIVFLLVAIGVTILKPTNNQNSEVPDIIFVDSADKEYLAEISNSQTLSRADNLAEMRRKIAESNDDLISSPETVEEIIQEEVLVSTTNDVEIVSSRVPVFECPEPASYAGTWSPQGIKFTEAEGARVIYREVVSEYEHDSTATSGTTLPPEITRNTLVELPVFPQPKASPLCLQSDVIGVANDGSLIRNNEAGLYGVFGEQTLVGYALDGYPIYGSTSMELDECGGLISQGSYGYYVSPESETILSCFWATQASI